MHPNHASELGGLDTVFSLGKKHILHYWSEDLNKIKHIQCSSRFLIQNLLITW